MNQKLLDFYDMASKYSLSADWIILCMWGRGEMKTQCPRHGHPQIELSGTRLPSHTRDLTSDQPFIGRIFGSLCAVGWRGLMKELNSSARGSKTEKSVRLLNPQPHRYSRLYLILHSRPPSMTERQQDPRPHDGQIRPHVCSHIENQW
ncbi:hypothetical protein GDO78_016994 [Eleutherodactylus coqui]|uniref:Uncharacterized protein n=1 Tax=Eleutherodactylus coqui TaxID=57060 RepID=A0A8J6EKL6_ELECQ|nr:hypothetical protein GDO78_016994 [Eleutherodactylus coqui]